MTTVSTYAAVLVLIASIVSVGYQSPVQQQVASRGLASNSLEEANPSVDQMIAADLAATTAETAGLAVASNVSNLSISLNAKAELAQTDSNVLSKPQIVEVAEARGVTTYTGVVGDTVSAIAQRFGVSVDTIKWANNLVSDAISPGQILKIPNTDGVLYTVNAGDTVESIASRFQANAQRITSYNDLEISGVVAGQQIVIPGGILPADQRPGARTTSSARGGNSFIASYRNAAVAGNRYDYGYCTWYAYNRRAELGRPVGSFWGNASTWASYARGSGYIVSRTPSVGAVMQDSYSAGGYGHVAVVESVGADGSITVSEMNYAGWNVKSYRTLSAGEAAGYNYIQ
jgi:surface antigen